MRNIVDFHIHGIGSNYKDAFATASYDHICAYFQLLAEKRKRNVVIAFTEHDCSVITYDKYKELQKKYPNVKIMLGMEANAKLTHATDGVFEVAHILAYADMSSEESIKKWFDCKELQDISKIKTFQIARQVPCNEHIVNEYCKTLNSQFGTTIDVDDVIEKFGKSKLRSDVLKSRLLKYIAEKIYENKDITFKDCENVDKIIERLNSVELFVNKNPSPFGGLVPSQYSFSRKMNLKLAVKRLEEVIGKKLDIAEIENQINFNATNEEFDKQFVKIATDEIIKDRDVLYKKIKILSLMKASNKKLTNPEYIKSYINTRILKNARFNCIKKTTNQFFESEINNENFGEKLYMAKSILNKNIGTKITNAEIAELLDKAKTRKTMRNHFLNLVKFSLKYNNPKLYKRIEKMPLEDFARTQLGTNDHGTITINQLIPSSPNVNHNITTDIRIPLEEVNQIVKKTGGHLVLAHPDLIFKYSDGKFIPASVFEASDKDLVSNSKYRDITKQLNDNGTINTNELLGDKNKILKLELFFRLCKQKGINFDGFEIRKANIKDRENLRNYLIYAAKKGYDISFGSDMHLSNIHFYYDLLRTDRITKAQFDKLSYEANERGDDTGKTKRYLEYYPTLFWTKKSNINFAEIKKCGGYIKNFKQGKLYNTHSNEYVVQQTSFSDKLLGKPEQEDKILLTLKYNHKTYLFNSRLLSKMDYNFGDAKESKEETEDETEVIQDKPKEAQESAKELNW